MENNNLGMTRQLDIYKKGLHKQFPPLPVSLEELELKAKEKMSHNAYGYIAGGAGKEDTMRANLAAFDKWRIVPRMLRNVSQRNLQIELFSKKMYPILLAPVGVQSIAHSEAEVGSAKGAAAMNVPFILSTASSTPMETIAEASGDNLRWFQLYWGKDAEFTKSLLQRAEKAGFSALVVTLDTSLLSWRERDIQNAYLPFLEGEGVANYFTDPVFQAALSASPQEDPVAAIQHLAKIFSNTALTWDDLDFLRKNTSLPIILKGILSPEDAAEAVKRGVDGIIVSNHGGRQVDGAIASLDILPQVVEVVADKIPVLFDSGIRRGPDVFKALALGAKAVLLGRPYIYGLSLAGQQGVEEVIHNLLADFDLTMALSGCDDVNKITKSYLTPLP